MAPRLWMSYMVKLGGRLVYINRLPSESEFCFASTILLKIHKPVISSGLFYPRCRKHKNVRTTQNHTGISTVPRRRSLLIYSFGPSASNASPRYRQDQQATITGGMMLGRARFWAKAQSAPVKASPKSS